MPPPPGRSCWLALAAAYLVVTLVMVAPLIDYGALGSATYVGDARLLTWTLAWDAHAMLGGLPLFDANMFFPAPHALRYAEHHVGIAVLALPFYAATRNPVLAYWIVWLAAFVANALAMHALAHRVVRNHLAAAIGALVFAFSFYRMLHAHGHLQLLWTAWLPLSLLALARWYAAPTPRRLAALWALVLIQSLVSGYLAVMVLLAQIVVGLALMVASDVRPRWSVRRTMQVAAGSLAGAAVLFWFVRPYVGLAGGGPAEAAALSADAVAYLLPPLNTWPGQWLQAHTALHPRWIWGEQTMYLGGIALLLAVAGAGVAGRIGRRDGEARALVIGTVSLGCIALALSFGPHPGGVAPFDWLARVPGLSLFRAPARFGLLVVLAIALLASMGAAAVAARGSLGRVVVLACVPLMLGEWRVVDFPNGKPESLTIPTAYRQLEKLPGGAIVSLPDYTATDQWFREADYLMWSTTHWRPIANGYGRSQPPGFGALMADLREFPDDRAITALRRAGIRFVFADESRYAAGGADVVARARHVAALRVVGTWWPVTVFEVR